MDKNYGVSIARNIGIVYSIYPEIFIKLKNSIFKNNIKIENNKIFIYNLDVNFIDNIFKNINSFELKNYKLDNEYISFLDSDDLFLPNKIYEQITYMQNNDFKISHTNEYWYRKDRFVNQNKHNEKYGGNIFSKIIDICRISPSSLMIRKDIFLEIGFFDMNLRVCEDYDISLRLSIKYKIGYLNKMLIIKRAIENNSLSKNIKHIESIRLNILEKFLYKYENILNVEDINSLKIEIERKRKIVNSGINKLK